MSLLASASCATLADRVRAAAPYRAPTIVVAYPARGAALPSDKAFIALRFGAGEPDDPIDVGSFRATLDGIDRTSLFRVTAGEAWAQLADSTAALGVNSGLGVGTHTLGARVCSVRGACGAVTVVLDVQRWDRALDRNAETRISATGSARHASSTIT